MDGLDGSGGNFELTVTVGGFTVQTDPTVVTFSTAVDSAAYTAVFPVPENEEVIVKVKSPNAGDNSVSSVVAYLYGIDIPGAGGLPVVDIGQILHNAITESTSGNVASNFGTFYDNADSAITVSTIDDIATAMSSLTSVSSKLDKCFGLSGNYYMDQVVYAGGLLSSARVRVYSTDNFDPSSDVPVNTYTISASYNSDGTVLTYKRTRTA